MGRLIGQIRGPCGALNCPASIKDWQQDAPNSQDCTWASQYSTTHPRIVHVGEPKEKLLGKKHLKCSEYWNGSSTTSKPPMLDTGGLQDKLVPSPAEKHGFDPGVREVDPGDLVGSRGAVGQATAPHQAVGPANLR